MLRTRVIPCLLLQDRRLVKTQKFRKPKYVGDPINAIKIFNEKEVDEIIVLDISTTRQNRNPNFEFISELTSEAFMPFSYGGGISCLEDAMRLFNIGVEKIVLNTTVFRNPKIIEKLANIFGSQSVVISIDARKNIIGNYYAYSEAGRRKEKIPPHLLAKQVEDMGAGEILITSIDKDGMQNGYDINLIKMISDSVNIPVVACGGASSIDDFKQAVKEGGASAVAAGSMFVFHGKHRAVLITYPDYNTLKSILP